MLLKSAGQQIKKGEKEKNAALYLLSFEESDARLIYVPPLLKVIHHHGRHGPGETAYR